MKDLYDVLILGCGAAGLACADRLWELGVGDICVLADDERGGTSRNAKIYNNIFYDCGEAAIDFPTRDNEAEGNLYVRMQGGYLRVMYPAPENCLNLPAWQEFCGFDREGQNAWFDIELDRETGKAVFRPAADLPPAFPGQAERIRLLTDPGAVKKVAPDPALPWTETEPVLPGPYPQWTGD